MALDLRLQIIQVIKNLLGAAVEASGPRTVVFRVSGNIALERLVNIKNPYITIAGQTVRGDGICLKNLPLSINVDHERSG